MHHRLRQTGRTGSSQAQCARSMLGACRCLRIDGRAASLSQAAGQLHTTLRVATLAGGAPERGRCGRIHGQPVPGGLALCVTMATIQFAGAACATEQRQRPRAIQRHARATLQRDTEAHAAEPRARVAAMAQRSGRRWRIRHHAATIQQPPRVFCAGPLHAQPAASGQPATRLPFLVGRQVARPGSREAGDAFAGCAGRPEDDRHISRRQAIDAMPGAPVAGQTDAAAASLLIERAQPSLRRGPAAPKFVLQRPLKCRRASQSTRCWRTCRERVRREPGAADEHTEAANPPRKVCPPHGPIASGAGIRPRRSGPPL